ncbi:E3 ubiquitin-protein ligase upl7 [Phtheirospermum japonicum]|uniref:HECT-type E3 ubiquitin transferase n=1 Tax=Phtheirospermum japonicum TaxID=374723 RepID=A0A830BUL6_9LAMI|nr:E3 ubiquitin-protein ligase upl7 [Phtheirospermum japonicum]
MEPSLSPPFNANATLSPPPSSGDGDETLEDAWYENIASKLLIVSLRGASAKEITRDALIERVNQERELRSNTRRANAAVMFIQRVWRRHHEMKLVALRLQRDWEIRMNEQRADVHRNFCSMATGSIEEKTIWFHLSKRLVSVCSFVLSVFDYSHQTVQDVALTSTAMHLSVLLKDPKSWNSIADHNRNDANTAVKNLVQFIGSKRSGLYNCIRKFISKFSSQELKSCQTDGVFLIVASEITLSLQPFHITNMDLNDDVMMECAVEQYCVSVLTIPWFPQRLPAILVPALRHKLVLLPCLRMLLTAAFRSFRVDWSIELQKLIRATSDADSGHYTNGLRTDSQQILSEERGPVCDVVSVVIVCGGSYRRGKASCGDMDIVKRHHDGKKYGIQL